MNNRWCTPFIVVTMPVDKDGNGPAMMAETVKTAYEVWDGANVTVCECSSNDDARAIAELLNKETVL